MSGRPSRILPRLGILALLAVAVHLPLLSAGFVNFDDPTYVTGNPVVLGGLSWRGAAWAFETFTAGNWHPLAWLSHMADVQFLGMDARLHHAASLAWHALAAGLFFLLLEGLTGRVNLSFGAALLFAVHPVHVESVAWISQRKDLVSSVLWLSTGLAYLGYLRRPGPGRFGLALLAFAAALAAKPMAVTWPLVALALDFWPLGRRRPGRALLEKLPFLALAGISSAVTLRAQAAGGALQRIDELPAAARLANALAAYPAYLGRAFWPAGLAVWYPLGPSPGIGALLVSALVLAGAGAAVVAGIRRRPWLATGWLWFAVMLLPVSGLMQVGGQATADRYLYLPLGGLLLVVAWEAADRVSGRARASRAAVALLLVAICAAGTLSFRQSGYWRDSVTLFRRAVSVTRGNWMAHHNLAVALAGDGAGAEAEAEEHYRAALEIHPRWTPSLNGLANLRAGTGRFEEAVELYRRAVEIEPGYAEGWYNLGAVLVRMGRLPEASEALGRALALQPGLEPARRLAASVRRRLGAPGKLSGPD
jgi:tetratricopeptide (TPR) repeat protein